jgi:hypothetical protein
LTASSIIAAIGVIALAGAELVEHQVDVCGDAGRRQAGFHASQGTTVKREDGPPAARGLDERTHAAANPADARHLSPARAVKVHRKTVGRLRDARASRARVDERKVLRRHDAFLS